MRRRTGNGYWSQEIYCEILNSLHYAVQAARRACCHPLGTTRLFIVRAITGNPDIRFIDRPFYVERRYTRAHQPRLAQFFLIVRERMARIGTTIPRCRRDHGRPSGGEDFDRLVGARTRVITQRPDQTISSLVANNRRRMQRSITRLKLVYARRQMKTSS